MYTKKLMLMGGCALAVIAANASTATAQDADEIIVTGSRIVKPSNGNSPQPVVILDADAFKETGALTIAEALNELPQLGDSLEGGSSINSLNAGFGVGTQTVNLRNLGANRTLVLVNGRRHVGGDVGTSAVDLSSIPSYLVERIDVVTGASSAVYGADAVTGVVNVILKENYEGTEVGIRGGLATRGDGEEFAVNAVHGGTFNRGEYVIAGEYSTQGEILGEDRSFAEFDGSAVTGLSEAANGSGINPGGLFAADGGTGGFDENGIFVQPFSERFQRVPFRSLQNETDRLVLSGRGSYELTESITAFAEASYANTKVDVQFDPQLALFTGNGTAGFRFPNVDGVATDDGVLDPITRRFSEFGPRESEIDRDLFRFTVGADGEWFGGTWHANYQYGKVDATQTDFETLDKGLLITAIDPVACAAVTDCQFVNIFGRGTIDPASEDFVSADLESDSEAEQHVISAYVTGDAFELPSGAISYVIGGEYRDESAEITPNEALIQVIDPDTNTLVGLQGTRSFAGNTDGSYDVIEGFAEVSLPVTETFDVNLSGRVSDYSTVGTEYSYGINADWAIIDSFVLRASYGRATRAPNINELFGPETTSTASIADPCDTLTDGGNVLVQAAGCAAAGFGATFNPADIDQQIAGISGGNPNLDSETADSFTIGGVFKPTPSTVLSVDYYSIELEDVLAPSFSAQATLNNCIETGDDVFCDNITRNAGTNFVTSIRSGQVNLAEESVEGLEFALLHSFDLGEAELRFDATYTILLEHDRQVNDESEVEDLRGRVDNLENKVRGSVRYIRDNWSVGTTARFLDSGVQSIDADPAVAIGNEVDSVFYLDLFGSYDINDQLVFSAGVENVFDQQAPIVTDLFENNGSADTVAAGIYDIRGAFGYVGVKYKF